jgi:hypothetical protein
MLTGKRDCTVPGPRVSSRTSATVLGDAWIVTGRVKARWANIAAAAITSATATSLIARAQRTPFF